MRETETHRQRLRQTETERAEGVTERERESWNSHCPWRSVKSEKSIIIKTERVCVRVRKRYGRRQSRSQIHGQWNGESSDPSGVLFIRFISGRRKGNGGGGGVMNGAPVGVGTQRHCL